MSALRVNSGTEISSLGFVGNRAVDSLDRALPFLNIGYPTRAGTRLLWLRRSQWRSAPPDGAPAPAAARISFRSFIGLASVIGVILSSIRGRQ
jgi:hypothetical protein